MGSSGSASGESAGSNLVKCRLVVAFSTAGPSATPTSGTLKKPELARARPEQPDRPAVGIDVDVHEGRCLAETGHALHLAAKCHDEARPGARHQTSHGQNEALRPIPKGRFMRERKMSLGHANQGGAETKLIELVEILLRLHLQIDAVGTV